MPIVIIESPFGTNPDGSRADKATLARNLRYLAAAARDCQERGEAWFASHGLYPAVLDDATPAEREQGIGMGFEIAAALRAGADAVRVFYLDLGETPGMAQGRIHAEAIGQRVLERHLGEEWDR